MGWVLCANLYAVGRRDKPLFHEAIERRNGLERDQSYHDEVERHLDALADIIRGNGSGPAEENQLRSLENGKASEKTVLDVSAPYKS